MKAITIRQPWASMIMSGQKTIETRTWSTKHRGMLLIHSSARPKNQGPTGVIMGVVKLLDVRPMERRDKKEACCDYAPGLYAWRIVKVAKLAVYIPCPGRLGLWDAELDEMMGTIKPMTRRER